MNLLERSFSNINMFIIGTYFSEYYNYIVESVDRLRDLYSRRTPFSVSMIKMNKSMKL